jgi:hypothetical protein
MPLPKLGDYGAYYYYYVHTYFSISEVSRKPYHIKLNKNVTSSSSLPRNSNMEKINNICLDQNVQSEISEDQVGGKR